MVVEGAISYLTYFRSRGWYDVLQQEISVVGTTFLIQRIWQRLGFILHNWASTFGVSVPNDRECETM